MLYLIRSWFRGGKSRLKVGYSGNFINRISLYYNDNPGVEILGTREGTTLEEKKLHYYLSIKGYKSDIRDEWFEDNPEVINIFHENINKVDKILWKFKKELGILRRLLKIFLENLKIKVFLKKQIYIFYLKKT